MEEGSPHHAWEQELLREVDWTEVEQGRREAARRRQEPHPEIVEVHGYRPSHHPCPAQFREALRLLDRLHALLEEQR